MTLSHRYIAALARLPQFSPSRVSDEQVTHTPTGATVLPASDRKACDNGMLIVQFPNGRFAEMVGALYFDAQLVEAASGQDTGLVSEEAQRLYERLCKGYRLDDPREIAVGTDQRRLRTR